MTSANISAIGFDMDGTLFDSASVSYDSLKDGFKKFWDEIGEQGETPSWEKVKGLIGLPSYAFFPAVLPPKYHDRWKILHKFLGDAEDQRLRNGSGRTFDGVHETLTELKRRDYKLLICSNASNVYFNAVLDGCDLRKYFSKFSNLGENPNRVKSDVLRGWAGEFGGRDSIIYTGDRGTDIESAHMAGIKAVGVTWGFGTPAELVEADWLIESMSELLAIFRTAIPDNQAGLV
jgi:phosphoglycolate phosphatase